MPSTASIARRAARILGRPASRGTRFADHEAIAAIKAAALEAGLHEVREWARAGASIRQLAQAYVARHVQAYGPLGDLIDVGAHLGSRSPIVVEVR
jgi:hypothetical protein